MVLRGERGSEEKVVEKVPGTISSEKVPGVEKVPGTISSSLKGLVFPKLSRKNWVFT